jgi:hypothetical protein
MAFLGRQQVLQGRAVGRLLLLSFGVLLPVKAVGQILKVLAAARSKYAGCRGNAMALLGH